MPPKKIPTAPIFNSEKAQAVVRAVDTIAGKPLSWWFFVLMIALIGLLATSTWFLIKRTDALQASVDSQRDSLLEYVRHDQRELLEVSKAANEGREALVTALRQNTAVLDRSNIILQNIERKTQ